MDMTALIPELLRLIAWLIGILVALVAFIGLRMHNKLDSINKQLRVDTMAICSDISDIRVEIASIRASCSLCDRRGIK